MTFFVLGIDAATWTIIKPNLNQLPNFKALLEVGDSATIHLTEKPVSPAIWTGMFSGTYYQQHQHQEYTEDGEVVKREEIPVDFIWDVLDNEYDIRAFNVPFIVPPYSYNVNWESIGFGLPTKPNEWAQELEQVTNKAQELLKDNPDVLITVFTSLDRIQHFHWGENLVLDWYQKMDERLGELLFDSGFLENKDNQLIVISDHGFCSFGEAEVQTLPQETPHGKLKGDHHEDAVVITVGVDKKIEEPQDVYRVLEQKFKSQ